MGNTSRCIAMTALGLAACGDNLPPKVPATPPAPPVSDITRDVIDTGLQLDVTLHTGTATIKVAGNTTSNSVSFKVGNMTIAGITDDAGTPLRYVRDKDVPDQINVALADGTVDSTVVIDYRFRLTNPADAGGGFDGLMPNGLTFLWPYFCGNLFPCHDATADGTTFSLNVTGTPAGQVSVYPSVIPGQAPAYMIAIATGDYVYEKIGNTTAGTEVGVYYLNGNKANADTGTANLAKYFDFYEKTYGPYSFGNKVGSVQADWGPGAYGGMEHHPTWHIATDAMADNSVHAHEASHGWYGNGVRIACWEDFVLSEGMADYLAGRSLEAIDGIAAANTYWAGEATFLTDSEANGDTLAYPDGCNQIDIFSDPLWSGIPYAKGSFFWKAVEAKVTRSMLDAALKHFYMMHVGKAAHMQDLIDSVAADTGQNLMTLEHGWLKSLGHPTPLP